MYPLYLLGSKRAYLLILIHAIDPFRTRGYVSYMPQECHAPMLDYGYFRTSLYQPTIVLPVGRQRESCAEVIGLYLLLFPSHV
jgi:hypothetical protein